MNKKKIIIIAVIIVIIMLIPLLFICNKKSNKYYLELIGSNITINIGEKYKEPGYKAYDSNGKDLTDEVIITNNINSNKPGTYTIIYKFKDNILYRNVTVINKIIDDNPDDIIDSKENEIEIKLLGDKIIYIPKNEQYIELGAKTIDSNGNDVSYTIHVIGEVNTKSEGTYIVTYSINNLNGNIKKVERTIIVYELNYQYEKKCTNNKCSINLTFNDNYYDKVIYPSGVTSKEKHISYEVNKNGTYIFTIYDKYGYTITKEIIINEIVDYREPELPPVNPPVDTQNKITDNLFVGDSRTVGMCGNYKLCEDSEYIASTGKGRIWFENTAVQSVNQKIITKKYNIIILMGVNDLGRTVLNGEDAATKYYNTISSLATSKWSEQNIIFVSVNPVIDGYSNAYTVAVNAFNQEIKNKIKSSNITNLKYCDTNSNLNITTSNAPDGLHYNKETYQEIYNTIINDCL